MEVGGAIAITLAIVFLGVPILALAKVLASHQAAMFLSASQLKQVRGLHILVTGGSKGIGKSLALLLARNGANVTIAARPSSDLYATVQLLQECKTAESTVRVMEGDLRQDRETRERVFALCSQAGKFDWIICGAGVALPGFLADQLSHDENEFETQMDSNYFTALNTVRAAFSFAKHVAVSSRSNNSYDDVTTTDSQTALAPTTSGFTKQEAARLPSKIVFIGSPLCFLSFLGYGGYASTRFALRGLADSLRSELLPLGIAVQIFSPGNTDTPGYVVENLTKPEMTKKIDGASALAQPDDVAKAFLAQLLKGRYLSTNDLITELLRVVNNGSGPRPNPFSESLCSGLLTFIFVFYFYFTDLDTIAHFKKQGGNFKIA
ncbi:UNVERIFIED_CONTAM: 3-dehydrosphinganine reductase [Siphonaria sp. JEL0065]|nr:3-dehydrosphinganine reductase [Siphonaria sp. JEL0065]